MHYIIINLKNMGVDFMYSMRRQKRLFIMNALFGPVKAALTVMRFYYGPKATRCFSLYYSYIDFLNWSKAIKGYYIKIQVVTLIS